MSIQEALRSPDHFRAVFEIIAFGVRDLTNSTDPRQLLTGEHVDDPRCTDPAFQRDAGVTFADLADDRRALPVLVGRHHLQSAFCVSLGNEKYEASFIGKIERIEAKYLASTADVFA